MDTHEREALRQAVSDRRRVLAADLPGGDAQRSPRASRRSLAPSQRELQVLQLIADGSDWKAVAVKLEISRETVRSHLRHVKEKLDAPTTTNACVAAMRAGLIS